ncbi:hypothetical protein R83H12_02745 [Fibrobacteria bacterium R8-3-H12]
MNNKFVASKQVSVLQNGVSIASDLVQVASLEV